MRRALWLFPLASCSLLVNRIDIQDACGNGLLQLGLLEQCDDSNTAAGDGCDSTCQLELFSEQEPNDTAANAQPLFKNAGKVTGNLSSGDDVDFYRFTLTETSSLNVEIVLAEVDGGSCANGDSDPDTVLYLFDSQGKILREDDDSGDGNCSKLVLNRLAPGDYFLRVNDFSFRSANDLYQLDVTLLAVCGDGLVQDREECDDGNLDDGDGCNADCTDGDNCGDGLLDVGEQCEINEDFVEDGCEANCQLTPGQVFEAEPNDDAKLEESNALIGGDFLLENANGPFTTDVIIHGGCIINGGDEDFFLLQNNDVNPVTINILSADPALGFGVACEEVDTQMAIYQLSGDSLGTQIATNDNNGADLCAALPAITMAPGETLALQVFDSNDDDTLLNYVVQVDFP